MSCFRFFLLTIIFRKAKQATQVPSFQPTKNENLRKHVIELLLNIELGRINETGSERVFNDFVGGVDAKFTENVLAVGGDGVYA